MQNKIITFFSIYFDLCILTDQENRELFQVSEDIYPIQSYATTSLVIVIFLVTDYIRYKPIVMLDALSSIISYLCILKPMTMFKSQVRVDYN